MRSRRSFVLVACVLASLAGLPQVAAGGSWSRTTISSVDLHDVAFADERTGWAVGGGGTILRSLDAGVTWTPQSSKTSQHLYGVDFVSPTTGWVVGAGSTVRSTTDGGQTWTTRTLGVDGVLRAVDFVDATHGWVVGSSAGLANLVLATQDGGITWQPQAAPAGIGLMSVSFADRLHGFAGGFLDAAYRTEDGGITWAPMAVKVETLDGLTTDSFYATLRTSAAEGLIAGFRGEIYRTADGGITWTPAGSLGKPVRGLAASAAAVFASGDTGAVASSTDGGVTWAQQASGTTANLAGLSAPSPAAAFSVGAGGALLSFRDTEPVDPPLTVGPLPEACGDLGIPWRHEAGGPAASGLAADVDGDGSTEIVVAGLNGIRALRPFAATGSATRWHVPFQSSNRLLRLAEIDGDPLPELAIATGPDDADRRGIVVLDAEDGSVVWSRRLPAAAVTFQVGDLDRDGLDDIAAVGASSDLRLLSGIDGSSLQAPKPLAAQPSDLELTHLDGDGFPELIVPLRNGTALALDGQTGATRWSYRTDGELRTVTAQDLTGDGTPDIILGGTGIPGSLTPGRGDGPTNVGSLKGALVVALDGRDGRRLWDYGQSNPFLHFDALATGDLTADGIPDVVAAASRLSGSHLMAFDGRGRTANGQPTGEPLVLWRHLSSSTESLQGASHAEALSLSDGDGDGTPDAYLAQWSGVTLAVSGAGPIPGPDPTRPPDAVRLWLARRDWQTYDVRPVVVDGRRLILSLSGDGLVTLREPSDGQTVWSFDGAAYPALAPAELDGSAGSEIGVATGGGRIHGLDGDGGPLAGTDVFLPDRAVSTAAADTDGDGRMEILAAAADGTLAAVDPRSAELLWTASLGAVPNVIAAGDGVVVAGLADGRLVAHDLRDGNEAWQVPGASSVGALTFLPNARLFAAGDDAGSLRFLDRDGDITAQGSSGAWFLGLVAGDLDGDGVEEVVAAIGSSFGAFGIDGVERWSVDAGQGTRDVAVGDMDGDGLADVAGGALGAAFGIRGSDGMVLWEIESTWPGGTAVIDVDADGIGEALVGSTKLFFDGRIRLVRSDGTVAADCRPRHLPHAAIAADLDGDGAREGIVAMEEGGLYVIG